jgi:membrane protease YdiL (CAAX protease family)
LLFSLGLTALFHAWARVDPLLGLRLRGARLGRELLAGLALGLGSMVVIAAVYATFGWTSFEIDQRGRVGLNLVIGFLALLPAAASEEAVFRGYLLSVLESWRGWPWSLRPSCSG